MGAPRTVKLPIDVATAPDGENDTIMYFEPALVPVPIVILTRVESTRAQAAAVPPTVALQFAAASCAGDMKLLPTSVIVLLT